MSPDCFVTDVPDRSDITHSITWSARNSSDGGIVRPSSFAVLRLITSSNLTGLLYGQIGGLGAFQDLDVISTLASCPA
jgi:hypothetical protein